MEIEAIFCIANLCCSSGVATLRVVSSNDKRDPFASRVFLESIQKFVLQLFGHRCGLLEHSSALPGLFKLIAAASSQMCVAAWMSDSLSTLIEISLRAALERSCFVLSATGQTQGKEQYNKLQVTDTI